MMLGDVETLVNRWEAPGEFKESAVRSDQGADRRRSRTAAIGGGWGASLSNCLGVAIAGLATVGMMVFNSGPAKTPQVAVAQQQTAPAGDQQQPSRKRHTITVTVSNPEDIKVEKGDRVQVGQVLADRTRERDKLTAQRRQLELAIQRLLTPIAPPPPPPEPSYAGELAAITSAQEAIAYYEQVPEPQFRFKDQDLILSMDSDRVTQRQELARQRMESQQILNGAIANLTEAKAQHQRDLYNYQLQLSRLENEQRDREVEALKLTERLEVLDKQVEELTAVKSPFVGRVRRVEITGQAGLNINAIIHLLVRAEDESQPE